MAKHVLVVGGTKGIGYTLVQKWASENFMVSVIARRAADKQVTPSNVHYWPVDLLDQNTLSSVLNDMVTRHGPIRSLVFFQRYRGDGDDWEGEIAISLTATKKIIEYLSDKFDACEERAIVLVSSVAAYYVAGEQPLSYHVGKAGINQMVRYYAVTLGGKGVRVNCVSFGTMLKERSKDFYLQNESLHDLYKQMTPLGRMGTAEEVADVIDFLCNSKASFITGQNILVDGGVSLQAHESLVQNIMFRKQGDL